MLENLGQDWNGGWHTTRVPGAAGPWRHFPHFSIAAASLLPFLPGNGNGKGHLCFVLLGVTFYCVEPAVFLPEGAARQEKRPQVCPVLAGKDGRPMMEQEAESFLGKNPWRVVNLY